MILSLLMLASPVLQWSAEVGLGYSPPVIAGDRVCTIGRTGEQETVACYERASGKLAWRDSYRAPFKKNSYAQRMAPGPFSAPIAQNGVLYTLGAAANLHAYDFATGKLKWERAPARPVSTSNLFCGTAMTPFFDEKQNRLVVFWGDDSGGELVSLDAATGKTVWSFTGDHPVYASITAATLGGLRQYITLGEQSAFGVDAATGKLLWKIPYKDQWNENTVTPVVAGDAVILSGVRKPTAAYTIAGSTAGQRATQKWSNADLPMYLSDPVLDGTVLYGLTARGKGRLFALDTQSGKTLWTSEGRYAENARFLLAGKILYAVTSAGELIIIDVASGVPKELARHEVAKTEVYATPAIAGKQLFVKDETSLKAFTLP